MAQHLRLAAFIAVCIAACDAGLMRTKREANETSAPPPWLECLNKKQEHCVWPHIEQYGHLFQTPEEAAEFMGTRANLEQMATDYQEAQHCIVNENSESYCQGDQQNLLIDEDIAFVADFLSDKEHITELVDASFSPCLSYPDLFRYAEGDFYRYCVPALYDALMLPETNPCEAVGDLRSCLIDVAGYYCGRENEDFLKSAWDYAVHTDAGRRWIENSQLPAYVVNGCYEDTSK